MRALRAAAYVLAFVLATAVAAVYAYVVLTVLIRAGLVPASLVAGRGPALPG